MRDIFYRREELSKKRFLFLGGVDLISVMKASSKPLVLFCGGGNGSIFINRLVDENLERLVRDYIVVHQRGKDFLKEAPSALDYYAFDFAEEMPYLMHLSNVVITRSGAGVVSELCVLNKPSLFIPLRHAQRNEQFYNAKEVLLFLRSEIILEEEFEGKDLLMEIRNLLGLPTNFRQGSFTKFLSFRESSLQFLVNEVVGWYSLHAKPGVE